MNVSSQIDQDPLAGILQQALGATQQQQQQQQQQDPAQDAKDKLWKDIKDEEAKTLNDFEYAKIYLNQLVGKWIQEEQHTEANRLTRDIDIDIDQLRETGDVEDDECFISERIVDSNIQREMPSYINFLKNSRRIAIFNDTIDATFDASLLEDAFTKGMTYKGWTKPWFKEIDGSMTHGWAALEVTYDESKPLHVGLEYIAHEDLLFPQDSKDIQTASCVLRRYKVTPLQLKTWCVNFGFEIEQVNLIIEKHKESANKDKTLTVWKRFCKYNGTVYVSWFSLEGSTTDWLKKPAKLSIGIGELQDATQNVPMPLPNGQVIQTPQQTKQWQDSDINNYPIFILFYKETEKPLIFEHYGRVFYDKDKQEAQTAIVTAFVNGINRAQKVYASPKTDTVNDGKPAKQLASIKWANGTIFDKPFDFWNMPYPDPMILKALEYFDVANSQDIGQTDFAATNRQDSRKTAREITASEKQQMLLDSVDLTIFSEHVREVYAFAWKVAQSQALQNKIKFLQISKAQAQQKQSQGQPPTTPQAVGNSQAPQMPQQPSPQSIQGSMPPMPNGQSGALPMQPPLPPDIQSIVDARGNYQMQSSNLINDIDTIVRQFDIRAAGDVDVIQKAELIQAMSQDWQVYQTTPLAMKFLIDLTKLKYPQDGDIYAQILEQGDPKVSIIKTLASLLQAIVSIPDVQQHLTPQDKQQLQQVAQETQQVLGQGQQAAQPG